MGCTEIPLALKAGPGMGRIQLLDPARLIARTLALRAYGAQAGSVAWPA